MPIKNRIVTCDICHCTQEELHFGEGWPGWCQIQGIGAREPEPDAPLTNENMETYLCPRCKDVVADFIDHLQKEADA